MKFIIVTKWAANTSDQKQFLINIDDISNIYENIKDKSCVIVFKSNGGPKESMLVTSSLNDVANDIKIATNGGSHAK